MPGANCHEACDSNAVKVEFDVRPQSAPREGVYQYKYVFDVDGNSFSGRYFGLLKSGSLVFKVCPVPLPRDAIRETDSICLDY